MGVLQYHHDWPENQEISPEFHSDHNSLSSDHSLTSVSSLTTKQPPPTTHKHHYITTFKSHTSSVSCLTLAGTHLISGSSDHQVRSWPQNSDDKSPSSVNNVIAYGDSPVKSMTISGDKLFTGHLDHKICVWKIDEINSGDYSGDSDYRKMLKSTYVTTLPTLNDRVRKMFSSKNHTGAVAALTVSHDGGFLYSGSSDRSFKVWRTSDFKCMETVWNAHDDVINSIIVSEDGYVYTGSGDRKIKVWRKLAGEKKHVLVDTLEKHKSAVNALALSSDGSVLYSGACDRTVLVWEKVAGERRHMVVVGGLRGHSKGVLCILVVGDLVLTGSTDKTVRVWRGIGGKKYCRVCVLEGHNGPVKCLAGALEGCTFGECGGTSYLVYSGSLDCDVKVWRVWVPCL